MIGAVICNGSNTMVADLPAPSLDLETKLHSIGIIEPAEKLPHSDEKGNQIRSISAARFASMRLRSGVSRESRWASSGEVA